MSALTMLKHGMIPVGIIVLVCGMFALDSNQKKEWKKTQRSHQLWEESYVSPINTKHFSNCVFATLSYYDPNKLQPETYLAIRCPNSEVSIEHDCGKNCTQRMTTSSK